MEEIHFESDLNPDDLLSRLKEGANVNISDPQFFGKKQVYLNLKGFKFELGRRIGYRDSLSTSIYGEIIANQGGSEILGSFKPSENLFCCASRNCVRFLVA
jgi:hypothetical protein